QKFYSGLEDLYVDWSNYLSAIYLEKNSTKDLGEILSQINLKKTDLLIDEVKCNNLTSQIETAASKLIFDIRIDNEIKAFIDTLISKQKEVGADIQDNELNAIAILSKISFEKQNALNFFEALPPSVIISTSAENSIV